MGLGPELMQDGMDYMRIVGAFAFFRRVSDSFRILAQRKQGDISDDGDGGCEYP